METITTTIHMAHPMRHRIMLPPSVQKWQLGEIRKLMQNFLADMEGAELPVELYGRQHRAAFHFSVITDNTVRKDWPDWNEWGTCTITVDTELDWMLKKAAAGERDVATGEIAVMDFLQSRIFSDMERRLLDFSLAFNLSFPGVFSFYKSDILFMGNTREINGLEANLIDIYLENNKNKWPGISVLPVARVWEWLNSKTKFPQGAGTGSMEKALQAFTYLFGPRQNESLLYYIMGIEALFASGTNADAPAQVQETCETLFGAIPQAVDFANMYAVRNSFVQGQLGIPLSPRYDTYGVAAFLVGDAYRKACHTATSILLAAVQKFIASETPA